MRVSIHRDDDGDIILTQPVCSGEEIVLLTPLQAAELSRRLISHATAKSRTEEEFIDETGNRT